MTEAGAFTPVTEAELARARKDPAFRRRLLAHSLELLLDALKSLREKTPSGASPELVREGVRMAVRLAELIQNASGGSRKP